MIPLAQPGQPIPDVIATPTPVARAQATLSGGELRSGLEDAERTQVTPVDLEDDAEEEERAQATSPSRDVDMADADEAPQHVYVKEEHLPEWIFSRIQSQEKATLEMEFAILTLIAKTQGLTPPKPGDRLQVKPALDSLQDEFMRLTCGMRMEDKKASVRAQCLEAAISAVKREGRTVVVAAAQQGGAAAVQPVEQPSPADTPSPAATPQGTPRGKAQVAQKGEPKGARKSGKGKPAPKGKDPAKAQATLKGSERRQIGEGASHVDRRKRTRNGHPPSLGSTSPGHRTILMDGVTVQTSAIAVVAAVTFRDTHIKALRD